MDQKKGMRAVGFPSPADDFMEPSLDLNRYLVRRPSATFFMRVGDRDLSISEKNSEGLKRGDILVVDRSLKADHGNLVVAVDHGQLKVKKIFGRSTLANELRSKIKDLKSSNLRRNRVHVQIESLQNEFDNFEVWGVVTNIIRPLLGEK